MWGEGKLGDGLDREELIRKREIFRFELNKRVIVFVRCVEGRSTYLGFEANAVPRY